MNFGGQFSVDKLRDQNDGKKTANIANDGKDNRENEDKNLLPQPILS